MKHADDNVVTVSIEDFKLILDILESPPEPNEALIKAFERYKVYKFVKIDNLHYPQWDLDCPDCGAKLKLVKDHVKTKKLKSKYPLMYYRCSNWPDCTATHSAKHDGRPSGFPANKEVRKLRSLVHDRLDPLWKHGHFTRSEIYAKMAEHLDLDRENCHVSMFDRRMCVEALTFVDSLWDEVRERLKR